MKFTLSWLKDHLDTGASLDEIVETLTRIGLEVEGVDGQGQDLLGLHRRAGDRGASSIRTPIACGSASSIPASGEPVQVVCGAPNARTGMKGVFAPPGTYIPGKNITLGVGTIRGVESRGMLFSGMELQLSDDHDGIIDLPEDAPVGQPYATYAGLDDPVIEINLTPNRPDCTSVHGIARDLAAAGLGTLKGDAVQPVQGAGACPVSVTLAFEAGDEQSLPGLRAPARARREERRRRRSGCSGACRRSACARSTRSSTSPTTSPSTAAGRCTSSTLRRSRAISPSAARGTARRSLALDGRTYTLDDSIVVIADEDGVEVDRRHHGRRAFGLRRDDDRRADRIGAVGPAQHRADRPQARHHHRRALPLRARRRSGLHGARPRSCDPHGARPLRRRSRASVVVAGEVPRHRPRSSTSPGPRCGASRASTCRARNRRSSSRTSASTLRARATA